MEYPQCSGKKLIGKKSKRNYKADDLIKNKMICPRIIARLDIKGPNLVKGIHLEGLRVLGSPNKFAKKYVMDGADELFYQDVVASLYDRNSILEFINETAKKISIPLTVGGGIRKVEDIKDVLKAGADKVAINTAAIKNPEIIKNLHEFLDLPQLLQVLRL